MKAGNKRTDAREGDRPTLYDRIGGAGGLRELLRYFYADVRQHSVLGPIFNARIHDWPAHLAKIGEFWARQTGGPSAYDGGFAAVHVPLGIGPEHFRHWLALWEFNCGRQLGEAEASEMIALARQLGERLQMVLSGRSGLKINP
ncbi:MAG: group III truncated hemoglobin [Opitutaceae bacterium]|nr:group III truncated hemoglobin [Verrucomicrobiales bacterium]